jgi:hypothetical protein
MLPLADLVYAACAHPTKWLESATDATGRRKLADSLKPRLRESQRFYLDDEVATAAITLGAEHPDILLEMLHRARLPFRSCWVEWTNLGKYGLSPNLDDPQRVGCLIERLDETVPHYRMLVFAGGYRQARAPIVTVASMTIEYRLDRPMLPADETAHASLATLVNLPAQYIRQTLIGTVYIEQGPREHDADAIAHRIALCDALSHYATLTLSPWLQPIIDSLPQADLPRRQAITSGLRGDILENTGIWRFIITVFALINTRDYVDTDKTFRQGKSRVTASKVVPYLEHRLVTLKLPRPIVVARVRRAMAEAIPRRRHEVTGHWKQNRSKGLAGCEHVYVDETPKRQVCVTEGCGHRRWWVDEFERGDASRGFVIKDRLVVRD